MNKETILRELELAHNTMTIQEAKDFRLAILRLLEKIQ